MPIAELSELIKLRELWLHANRFFGETAAEGDGVSTRARRAPRSARISNDSCTGSSGLKCAALT